MPLQYQPYDTARQKSAPVASALQAFGYTSQQTPRRCEPAEDVLAVALMCKSLDQPLVCEPLTGHAVIRCRPANPPAAPVAPRARGGRRSGSARTDHWPRRADWSSSGSAGTWPPSVLLFS